jgi:hypothetical protein
MEFAGVSDPAMRACSACAGDYEDPDRTAWSGDKGVDETFDEAVDDPSIEVDPGEHGESCEQ